MAIYHLTAKIITRGRGQSAVCSAAYRHGEAMRYELEARAVSYTGKSEVVYSEFFGPPEPPDWFRTLIDGRDPVRASEAFWNKVEIAEHRFDARLAREIEVALPKELTRAQNIALLRTFITENFTARGMVADMAYHDLAHNPHSHIMLSVKPLTEAGFGASLVPARDEKGEIIRGRPCKTHPSGKIMYDDIFGGDWTKPDVLKGWRAAWADAANIALAHAGETVRIDHRSLTDQGIELEPSLHQGQTARSMERRGLEAPRSIFHIEDAVTNHKIISQRPDVILDLITQGQSVFDRYDISKTLARFVEQPDAFVDLLAQIEASASLVPLAAARMDEAGRELEPARYTTTDMLELERMMVARASAMAERQGHRTRETDLQAALAASSARGITLSEDQANAVRHITGKAQLAAIVGLAGAGKSTALDVSRQVWEARAIGSSVRRWRARRWLALPRAAGSRKRGRLRAGKQVGSAARPSLKRAMFW
jgi:Ti-type conjugative transfer relaxase TraA